jgi:acyl carrier protein
MSQKDGAGWNQASSLELVAAIERAFSIRLATREVAQFGSATATVKVLLEIIVSRLRSQTMSFRSTLEQAVSNAQRLHLLEIFVREQLETVLGTAAARIDAEKAFQELGVTSLNVVELCSLLEIGLGLSFSPTSLFNYPNIRKLVAYLDAALGWPADTEAGQASGKPLNLEEILAEVDHLSEEEAKQLLSEGANERSK